MIFKIYQSKCNKKWYWRLVANNGRIIADGSQGYVHKQNALKGIDLVRYFAEFADLEESPGKR